VPPPLAGAPVVNASTLAGG